LPGPIFTWHAPLVGLALAVAGALFPAPALAHKLNLFVNAEGKTIHGEAYFRGHLPARGAKVVARAPGGQPLGETTTDDQGQFTLTAAYRCDYKLAVDAGDGHGAEFTLPADQLPPDLPPLGLPAAADQKAAPAAVASGAAAGEEPNSQCPTRSPAAPGAGDSVNHELVELRREFQDFRQEVRWHDVLGGIGYIVGVAGIAFYFLGVRRKELRRP
jgi:nickel transport protein